MIKPTLYSTAYRGYQQLLKKEKQEKDLYISLKLMVFLWRAYSCNKSRIRLEKDYVQKLRIISLW